MDYYALLGVSKNATLQDIKTAYRKMAMKYHPDRNPGDKDAETKFKEVQEAYETLSDLNKRSRYNAHKPEPPRAKPKAKPKPKEPSFKSSMYKSDMHIYDAPPPLRDLWGRPLSPREQAEWSRNNVTHVVKTTKQMQEVMDKWKDSYAGHYESEGSPDIR